MDSLGLMLDTIYLLPIFGVRVRLRDYDTLFPRIIESFEVYYSPLSVIEAKWIILRLIRRIGDRRIRDLLLREYRSGLDALCMERRLKRTILTNSIIEEIADRLLEHGVRDYFDRMIYATACYYNLVLITEDELLHKIYSIVREEELKPASIMKWDMLASTIKG